MDEKIANNKGGLFNRQTCKLFLKPFKLAEVVEQTKLNGNGDLTAVLQFIKNNYGKDEQYWSNSTDNPARRTWEPRLIC